MFSVYNCHTYMTQNMLSIYIQTLTYQKIISWFAALGQKLVTANRYNIIPM